MKMKLRKMLGDISSPECIALMALISTQSNETLTRWAVSYARENCLALADSNEALAAALDAAEELAAKKLTPEAKATLNAARDIAAKLTDPIAQAAARAVSTAASTVRTPTNSLGFLFYLAAARVYDALGVDSDRAAQDELAAKELARALESLKSSAVENEPNPAKINWNC